MAQQAREDAAAELTAQDEGRTFISLPVWKRIIIMLGGPFMNLIIALVITAILVTSFGVATPTTKVSDVFECMTETTDAAALQTECGSEDEPSPAWEAGLRPADTVNHFNNPLVSEWEELSGAIRKRDYAQANITYVRDGESQSPTITPVLTERPHHDRFNQPVINASGDAETMSVGF